MSFEYFGIIVLSKTVLFFNTFLKLFYISVLFSEILLSYYFFNDEKITYVFLLFCFIENRVLK